MKQDNPHDPPNDPERLYKVYKEARARRSVSTSDAVPVDFTPEDDIADKVYQRYQQTRNAEAGAIDDIIQLISAQADAAESNQIEDQSASSGAVPKVQPIDNPVGRFKWLSNLSRAGNDDGIKWVRVIVPAVAATVFAFLLLPFVTSKNNTNGSLTTTAHLSPQLTPFVAPANGMLLGFSDPGNQRSNSIRYGVLAADLRVLKNGRGSTELLKSVVQSYLLAEHKSPEKIELAAQRVVSLVNDAKEATITGEIAAGADALLDAIEEQVSNDSHDQWYVLGHSIESVVLSSEYALSSTETSVLRVALKELVNISVPDDNNLKRLVDDLLLEEVSDSMNPSDLRRILNKARDIKSVTQ